MKRCPTCGKTKSITNFYQTPGRGDSLSSRCIECARAACIASDLRIRLKVIEQLGGRCVKCRYSTLGPALQIDHIQGNGAVQRRLDRSPRAVLRAALQDTDGQYQLLCANCNQIKRMENKEHKGSRVYPRIIPTGNTTKTCARCTLTKPVQQFLLNAARYDGISVYCQPCTLETGAIASQRLRVNALARLGGCCATCGYLRDTRALQIDHVNGNAPEEKRRGLIGAALYRAILNGSTAGYQVLCANCNIIKRVANGEHRGAETYVRHPATYSTVTRKYLTRAQIAEVARLVAVCGLQQAEVGEQYGITQTTVGRHTRNLYPNYGGYHPIDEPRLPTVKD
jgi:hypothetical protein